MSSDGRGKTVAFDLDGVLAHYSGFAGAQDEKEPNAEVVAAIRTLKDMGYRILIHSTRGEQFLTSYCEKHSIPFDYINRRPDKEGENPGKPIAFVYVDDRAICYKGQSSDDLVSEIENFKPWWKE